MVKEIDPLCVLDFYVSEACQRQGIGSRLFEVMLEVTSNRERMVYCVGVLHRASGVVRHASYLVCRVLCGCVTARGCVCVWWWWC